MFPYLKTKEEFIKDCEDSRFTLEKKEEKRYILRENDSGKKGSYSQTRGCNYKINSEGSRYFENCIGSCKSGCSNLSSLVAELTENVNKADWGQGNKERVGTVKIGMIQSWCQSLGIYIHDVLKNVKGRVAVGLEYYMDNTEEGNGRADVILAGYDNNKRAKIIIIELKQHDNEFFLMPEARSMKQIEKSAVNQVVSYCKSMENSVTDLKKLKTDIYPVVYFHNYFSDTIGKKTVFDGREVGIFYGGNDKEKDKTAGIKEMSRFISGIITDDKNDPKDVIKKLKANAKTFSTEEMAAIIYGKNLNRGKWENTDFDDIYKKLRPDQKFAFDEIKKAIDKNGEKTAKTVLNRINGAGGSGKTLINMLLIRYCLDKNKKVMLSYFGVSPINAIFKTSFNSLIKTELTQKISRKRIPDETKKKAIEEIKAAICDDFNPAADLKKLRDVAKKYKFVLPPSVTRLKYLTLIHSEKTDAVIKAGKKTKYSLFIYDEFHRFSFNNSVAESCNNLEKIINRSFNTVLLTDELQRLTERDISEKFFEKLNPEKYSTNDYYLWSQFRCGGDEGYVTWTEDVLQIDNPLSKKETFVYRKKGSKKKISLKDLDFDVEIAEDLKSVEKILINSKKTALLSEGSGQDIRDLFKNTRIKNLFIKENEHGNTGTRGKKGEILIKNSFNTQGIEFDEIVVIIDGSLDYKDGKIRFANPVKGQKGEEEFRFIKNKYRVLLTRGLKKCTIYAVRKGLRDYLVSQK